MSRTLLAEFHGGRADGRALRIREARCVLITMVDGEPKTVPDLPDKAGEALIARAFTFGWECYIKDDAGGGPRVSFRCVRPLDPEGD